MSVNDEGGIITVYRGLHKDRQGNSLATACRTAYEHVLCVVGDTNFTHINVPSGSVIGLMLSELVFTAKT